MLDLRNVDRARLGNDGLDFASELNAHAAKLEAARDAVQARFASGTDAYLGWMALPQGDVLPEVLRIAERAQGRFDDVVVLGIGGSSLGGLTLVTALQHPYFNLLGRRSAARVHFVDNVDGDVITGLLEVLDPRRTLVNVISKSGTTTETMAAYLSCKAWLSGALGADYKDHIVATTDPEKGILRPLAQREGYETLPVPPTVGGRFSVFSAVGLLPAALGGIDVRALLNGAKRAHDVFAAPASDNDVLKLALVNHLFAERGRNINVFMPYSTRLRFLSDWFAQLWAESLGKHRRGDGERVGTTPVKAVGTTDQHSQVQLYREGPKDKIVTLVKVEQADRAATIPNAEPNEPEMSYLGHKPYQTLMNAELVATAHALAEAGQPNVTLTLPRVDAENLGFLMQLLMLQTAVNGELLNINAFDQPGVELGKVLTYALMGRPGFDERREELQKAGVEI
ncbi:glucose-6-phosphate isomerase [Deinococcus yavapaiensis]|uniref:Glucose-6-phosphate isomerase n=1 Tax=Deinococcus yavapaiensis KR-236 TaxID=694435 RepID=A0A318SBN5_9DEIO|nr:glucose-6-phosphate isomerase [Deinococcus yavapaiensis]PYE56458.1 glucose-6-phosphate isomerase [Deinococcus yavapaiensis KR-236]